MPAATRYQGFCFTHNNWAQRDWDRYLQLFADGRIRFICMGRETAPNTGTPHLQGFVWMPAMVTLQNMKRLFKGGWVEVPGKNKGVDYWLDYVQKEDEDAYIAGFQPTNDEFIDQCKKGEGARSDLLEIKAKIDAGVDCESLMGDDAHFQAYASHSKFFTAYQAYKRRRLTFEMPTVIVYYGESGTNKTRSVYDAVDINDLYVWDESMMGSGSPWFDGYSGQRTVLLDEYRGNFKYGQLLSLLDGYPKKKVPVKCGFVDWSPTTIYITSPLHPDEWYPNLAANDKLAQLRRRISEIEHKQ